MDRAYATERVDSGSIPGRVKPNTFKSDIHSFPSGNSAIKEVKPPQYVVDKWAGGSLTQRPQGSSVVSRPRQLGELITITTLLYRESFQHN